MDCSVRLIGQFRIYDGRGRDVTPRSRKACCLIAYLLLSEPPRETRGKLAALLWSESDEERARASLRQTLKEIREALGPSGFPIAIEKLGVAVDRSRIGVDTDRLAAAAARGDAGEITALLAEVTPGLVTDLDESDEAFEAWLRVRRSGWTEATVKALTRVMAVAEARDHRAQIARAVLDFDPYCEEAVAVRFEALAEEAGVRAALAFHDNYRRRLAEDYELEPSEELEARIAGLRARFLGGGPARAGGAQVAAPPGRPGAAAVPSTPPGGAMAAASAADPLGLPTIAVDELVRPRRGGENDHVVASFAAELAATLGRFREWIVRQPRPVMAPEVDRAPDWVRSLGERGDEFGILIGSRPGDSRPSLQVAMHHRPSGKVVFRKDFPVAPTDWPAAFNAIGARLAAQLQLAIGHARLIRSPDRSAAHASAYDHWLEGQRLAQAWQPATEEQAIEHYRAAIRLAPGLAHPYASLAAIYNSRWIVLPGWPDSAADNERALELAQTAVRLDPLEHRAQVNLGWTHLLARRWEAAALHFRLAHDLNPNNAQTLIAHALASAFLGRPKPARDLARRAFELAPDLGPHYDGYRASIAFLDGDYADCVAAVEAAPDVFPDIQGWRAAALAHLGRLEDAGRAAERFVADVARAWTGPRPVTGEQVVAWFTAIFPLRRPADRKRLADGIARAFAARPRGGGGVPPPHEAHLQRVMM